MLWQVYGEQSTFYFHLLARQRKAAAATAITGIEDTQGSLHTLDNHLARVSPGQTSAIRGTGRVFHVSFQWTEQPLTIVTVYAPSLACERTDFFETQLLPAMPQHGGALVEGFDIWP